MTPMEMIAAQMVLQTTMILIQTTIFLLLLGVVAWFVVAEAKKPKKPSQIELMQQLGIVPEGMPGMEQPSNGEKKENKESEGFGTYN